MMGLKDRKAGKQEVVSMANLEVVSAEKFQRRLEGMSSCLDCLKERQRDPQLHVKRRSKKSRVSRNSPIVVRLQDTIKVSSRGRSRPSLKSTDLESEDSTSDDTSSVSSGTDSPRHTKKGEKNIHALLTAIVKEHVKGEPPVNNLDAFVSSAKDKVNRDSVLNNLITYHSSSGNDKNTAKGRILESLDGGKVDLICNDLSSKSSMLSESSDDLEQSENSSVVSASDSHSDCDVFSNRGEELTREELEELTQFTTGLPLTRYSCPPHQCRECLATIHAYSHYYAQAGGLCRVEVSDSHDSDTESDDSGSDREGAIVTVRGQGRVEVSVAFMGRKPKKVKKKRQRYFGNSVYMDLSEANVSFSVHYHPETTEQVNHMYSDWYSNYYNYGLLMYPVPYYLMPNFFVPFPIYTAIPKPLCVPRDLRCLNSQRICLVPAHEIKNFTASQPPQRPWIPLAHPERSKPVAIYTVMCYNVLCDKYATTQLYGYCPSWALNWEYRKKGIIEEIRHYSADIISLQEVETDQFYNFFLPELKRDGYDGIFSPKSRARTMTEAERKHVDGCAIFFKTAKFSLLKEHLVEFNQLAMASAEGSHDMLNRVMTKDNIGLAALLETKEGIWENGLPPENQVRQPILVSTCHVHWDPEFCDVKLIQTMMLMSELQNIIQDHTTSLRPGSSTPAANSIPLILCGDLNSLPESGVVEYLTTGQVASQHEDFKEIGYEGSLQKLNTESNKDFYTNGFRLAQAYTKEIMSYTNYTFDFKGIIDYIFFSRDYMRPLGVLGPLDIDWFRENKVIGCPHPHIPSDHLPLLVELELQTGGATRGTPHHTPVPANPAHIM